MTTARQIANRIRNEKSRTRRLALWTQVKRTMNPLDRMTVEFLVWTVR